MWVRLDRDGLDRGRDPRDRLTIDLEDLIRHHRHAEAARLRAAHPELPMVQLPLTLYDRAAR